MQESYPFQKEEILFFKASISFIDHLQEFLGAMLANCTLVIPPFNQLKDTIFCVVNLLQVYAKGYLPLNFLLFDSVFKRVCIISHVVDNNIKGFCVH